MEAIKRRWFLISLIYVFILYSVFVIHLKGSMHNTYILLISLYLCITAILFLGNIVGFPGLVLHAFFHKEDKALPFYQAAYKLGNKSPHMLSAYGLILLRNGEVEKAKEIFEFALANNRNIFYTRTLKANLAICEWKLGNNQKAYQSYLDLYYFPEEEPLENYDLSNTEAGLAKNPHFSQQDFLTMGYLALLCNEIDAALYFSHVALLKQSKYAAAYDNLGQIYYRIGDKVTAKQNFEKAVELKPTLMDSLYYLALLAYEENDRSTAKSYYEKAIAQPFNALNTISKEELENLGNNLNRKS